MAGVLAFLKQVLAALPALAELARVLERAFTKTPVEKGQDIDQANQEARDEFEETGRPTWD